MHDFGTELAQPRRAVIEGVHAGQNAKPTLAQQLYGAGTSWAQVVSELPGNRGHRVSDESWEAAARSAIETAAGAVRGLQIAEVIRQDVTIENGRITGWRTAIPDTGGRGRYSSEISALNQRSGRMVKSTL